MSLLVPYKSFRPAKRRLVIAATAPITINSFVAPQLEGLEARGWQTHILCGSGALNQQVHESAASTHVVPMARAITPARDGVSVAHATRVMRRIDPDVVLAGTPKAALVTLVAARLSRVPVRIFHVRGARWESAVGLQARLLRAADRVTASNATDVLSVSPSLSQRLLDAGVTDVKPVVLGRGGSKGVDLTTFTPDGNYRYDPASPRLGVLGRLSRDKGIEVALEVFDRVVMSSPGATLEVIGDVDESQPVASSTVQRLVSDQRIFWTRRLESPEIAQAMSRWDLLVFPSVREGLPNAVIEAAACGVPTVGWDVTGVSDAVDHGSSGLLVHPFDLEGFVSSAQAVLQEDRHRPLRQGALSVARQFDSTVLLDHFLDYLEGLVPRACRIRTGSYSRAWR